MGRPNRGTEKPKNNGAPKMKKNTNKSKSFK